MSKLGLVWCELLQDEVMLPGEATGASQHAEPSELTIVADQDMGIKVTGFIISGQSDIHMDLVLHFGSPQDLDNEGVPLRVLFEVEEDGADHMEWGGDGSFGLNHLSDYLLLESIDIFANCITILFYFEFRMFTLYQRFIQQVKDEELARYNLKHRDYLIRTGKIKEVKPQKDTARTNNRSNNQRIRKEQPNQENMEDTIRPHKPAPALHSRSDDRPLKGSENYNIEQLEERNEFEKPIRPLRNAERPSNQNDSFVANPPSKPKPAFEREERGEVKSQFNPIQIEEKPIPKVANMSMSEQPEQFAEVVLVECPEGCGKKFNEKTLQKHVKLCQKGEKKRKVFKVKIVDEEAEQLKKQEPKQEEKKEEAIPKWKKQSNQLRNVVNVNKSVATGAPPPPPLEQEDDRTACPGCGRKFNSQAASKHIPLCVKRNKGRK